MIHPDIVGTILWYGCVVNRTLLMALNAIARQHCAPAKDEMQNVKHLLGYCAKKKKQLAHTMGVTWY